MNNEIVASLCAEKNVMGNSIEFQGLYEKKKEDSLQ